MQVLIAEDDAVSRTVLKRTVEKFGHECLVAKDGLEAENFEAGNSFGRVVLTECMLLGRFEIFTALALLSPAFWKR